MRQTPAVVPHRVRRLYVRSDRQIHRHRRVVQDSDAVKLVHQRHAHLPRAKHLLLAVYIELSAALQHQKDLVTEIVAVRLGDEPGLHPHKPRTKLRRDQHVPHVLSVVVHFKSHDNPLRS